MGVVVSTAIVSKISAFSANLDIGHRYKRDGFLLKVGLSRIIRVCQVVIGAGHRL